MLKGYRTVVFNLIMSAIMIVSLWSPEAATQLPGIEEVNEALNKFEELIALVWGMGNVFLRAITNTALGKKEAG